MIGIASCLIDMVVLALVSWAQNWHENKKKYQVYWEMFEGKEGWVHQVMVHQVMVHQVMVDQVGLHYNEMCLNMLHYPLHFAIQNWQMTAGKPSSSLRRALC